MGPWGIAIVALAAASMTDGGRGALRKVAKEVIKAGYRLTDKGSTAIGELKEKTSDLVAEIKAEQSENEKHTGSTNGKSKKAVTKNGSED